MLGLVLIDEMLSQGFRLRILFGEKLDKSVWTKQSPLGSWTLISDRDYG